ncbi:hypothetical protein N9D52_03000 [Flavobacteriaceae bacterium]|nr:hypothetical protein [Flavobacteriaceae bacterium]
MKNLLILLTIPLFFISCVRDNDEDNKIGETVNLDLDLSLSFTLEKTGESNKGVGLTNKFSEFNHIFKDEVDLVFTSTTTDFTTTLTITPNDLSNTPTLVIPYGTYSWSIAKETFDYENDDYFKSYLSIFGSGQVEIYSSDVSLDLVVDTNYSLVTVEKENVSSAKLILDPPLEKDLVLRGNYYYLYAFSFPSEYGSLENRGYALEVKESVYNTSISVYVGENNTYYPKTHYNYILAFSDVDVNSITLKTAAFEQLDYYLQPTGTTSCTLSFDVYKDSWVSTQANGILTSTASPSVEITPVLYRLSSTCSSTTLSATISGLPDGLTMTYDIQNVATISGTPSAQSSGTYTYTLIGYNSNILASATSSVTVKGIISLTTSSTTTDNESAISLGQIGSLKFYNGNLFVGVHNKVLKINSEGEISTYLGDGGEIDINIDISGESDFITGLAFDNNGILYFGGDRTLRKLVNNQVVTVYNDGTCNNAIVVNSNNEIFIANCAAQKEIRKIDQSGNITVYVGSDFGNPYGLAIKDNVIYVADNTGAFASNPTAKIKTISSLNPQETNLIDTVQVVDFMTSIEVDGNNVVYYCSSSNNQDGKLIKLENGTQTILIENLWSTRGLTFDDNGNLYVGSMNKIHKISPEGEVTLFVNTSN